MPRPNGVSFMAIIITQRGAISTSGTVHKRHSAATPQPMAMTLPFGRNLNASYSPPLRGGECARRKTLSKKLKVAALLHKREHKTGTKKNLLVAFESVFVPFVVRFP